MPAQFLQSKILIGFVFVVLADCARSDTRSINDAALSDTSQGANWLARDTLNEQRA